MPLGFVDGIRMFSRAFAKTWLEKDLRVWYFKTLAATLLCALALVIAIFFAGTWAFTQLFDKPLTATLAVLVWFLTIFYLSGHLATLLMSALVLLIGGESAVTRYYFSRVNGAPSPELRADLRDHSRELFAMIRSFVVSCIAWPLFLLPITMPIGVLIFAWALSGDALAVSRRLCHKRGYAALQDKEKVSMGAMMGLAALPSSMALFPVLGWVLLPILQVAGFEMQLARQITSSSAHVEVPTT
ncbi:MAG: hypothetical protein ABIR96_08580 [Bdellovibrionota bacterium]